MVRTESTMLPLGTPAPSFALPATDGSIVRRDDFADAPGLLVMFLSNHCPYVQHLRAGLADFARDYQPRGLAIVGINSNDVSAYPADHPDRMREEVAACGYTFPYLYDETQDIAVAYRAACTPDFFLFDGARLLVYRGQFDGSRPQNEVPITGSDLRAAADAVLAGQPIEGLQRPSLGCNIKWRPDNVPTYFK